MTIQERAERAAATLFEGSTDIQRATHVIEREFAPFEELIEAVRAIYDAGGHFPNEGDAVYAWERLRAALEKIEGKP